MARAGMPWAAAAFVTSGSLAAPSSIEYAGCTCRCAKESDAVDRELAVVLTGVRCSSVVVRARPTGSCAQEPAGRPVGKTGVRLVRIRCGPDSRTGRGLLRGSDRTCLALRVLRRQRPAHREWRKTWT